MRKLNKNILNVRFHHAYNFQCSDHEQKYEHLDFSQHYTWKIYALENLSKAHIDENMKLSKCAA